MKQTHAACGTAPFGWSEEEQHLLTLIFVLMNTISSGVQKNVITVFCYVFMCFLVINKKMVIVQSKELKYYKATNKLQISGSSFILSYKLYLYLKIIVKWKPCCK